MAEAPLSPRGLWARRWFRRTSYLLVAGGGLLAIGAWTLQRPFVGRWAAERLDRLSREETGLGLQVDRVELHPFSGRAVLHHVVWGPDLFRAERVEAEVGLRALARGRLWVPRALVLRPRIRVNADRLQGLRLKPRPPKPEPTPWEIGRVEVVEGWAMVEEPRWGVPRSEAWFTVFAQGKGPRKAAVFLDMTRLSSGTGDHRVTGRGGLKGELDPAGLALNPSRIELGGTRLDLEGRFRPEGRHLQARVAGRLDMAEVGGLLSFPWAHGGGGVLRLKGRADGPLDALAWEADLEGRGLAYGSAGLTSGSLEATLQGGMGTLAVPRFTWSSPEGALEGTGRWRKGANAVVNLKGRALRLDAAARYLRAPFLAQALADLEIQGSISGDQAWHKASIQADLRLTEGPRAAGHLRLALSQGKATAEVEGLHVGDLRAEGRAEGRVDAAGLAALSAEAQVEARAERTAEVLHGWGIGQTLEEEGKPPKRVPFDMGGGVAGSARVSWDRRAGLSLEGRATVDGPRWHGAQADQVETRVAIRDHQLFLEDITLRRGEDGRGWGSLWLRFGRGASGDDIDMCFRAERLPVEEGLKAADLDLPLAGLGGGWARIHGPYGRLRILAEGHAEDARAYGLAIPALAGAMDLDLESGRLQIHDLRVGESRPRLGSGDEGPSGLLALQGRLDMDLVRRTWRGQLDGTVDSVLLGLPGPRFQARMESRLEGPWTHPFGSVSVPAGQVTFRGGRLFLGTQSLEGIEGSLVSEAPGGRLRLGMAGKPEPLLLLDLWPEGSRLLGALDLRIDPDRADAPHLAGQLTRDLLRDLRVALHADGVWDAAGLAWSGRLDRLEGLFDGFDLVQTAPTRLEGDGAFAALDLSLRGRTRTGGQEEGGEAAALRIVGRVPFAVGPPLDLRFQGQAELANLKRILDHLLEVDPYGLFGDLQPQGTARFDVVLGGPWRNPALDGALELKDGRLQIRTYPQSVEALSFRLVFRGRELALEPSAPLEGILAQGRLSASGRAAWGAGGITGYDLSARLKGFELRDLPEGFELQGDLDASLRGDGSQGLLKGTLTAERMRYQADLNLRELILANALGGTSFGAGLDPEDPLGRIALDLDLVLKQPWEFDTNLLKLQGQPTGNFKVAGTLLKPGLKGRMDLVPGGRLTNLLPAGDVVLERGSIDFQDPRTLNPFLDLQGRVDVPPYLVDLQIRGTLDALDMRPSSTPSLRRDEITAILIDPSLASSVGSGTGNTAVQSAATSGLARMGGGLLTSLVLADFQERVRKAFNLDRVNVAWRTGTAGSYETSVTLGKTLNLWERRVPLVFTHRTTADVVTLSGQVEWRIGNFVLQLGASQSGATGLNPSGEIRHTWSPR